jgi:PST family polysaccharide transporter
VNVESGPDGPQSAPVAADTANGRLEKKPGRLDDGLRRRVVAGVGWTATSQLTARLLQLGITVWLMRLIEPEQFGLYGMIAVLIGFATIFTDLGLAATLVQRRDLESADYTSVFWLNVAIGVGLTVLFVALAPLIASFYQRTELQPLTLGVAPIFTISSLGLVQTALLRKQLRFRELAMVEMGTSLAAGAVAITAASIGLGIWSLVCQALAQVAGMSTLAWVTSEWRPTTRFSWGRVRPLLRTSLHLTGFTSINYWIRHADDLLIGRLLGAVPLGVYSRAYNIMLVPVKFAGTASRVLFPTLSTIQTDLPRVASAYLRVTRAVALCTFPMMAGLFVVADHLVRGVLGERWLALTPLLRVFCLVGALESIGTLNGSIYLSQGRADLQFRLGMLIGCLQLAAIITGLQWGIQGVVWGIACVCVVVTGPTIAIAVRLVGLTLRRVVAALAPVLACALAMALSMYAADRWILGALPEIGRLVTLVMLGAIVYASLVICIRLDAYRDLAGVLGKQLKARRRAAA